MLAVSTKDFVSVVEMLGRGGGGGYWFISKHCLGEYLNLILEFTLYFYKLP